MLNYLNKDPNYYNDKCAMCVNYELNNIKKANSHGAYCPIHPLYNLALDDSCKKQKKDKSRKYKDIEDFYKAMERKYGKYKPRKYAFYIVAAVCDILGIDEHQLFLDIGMWYREKYLEVEDDKEEFLLDYDIIGKAIADRLYDDEDAIEIAQNLFASYIKTFCELVLNKRFEDAYCLYIQMYNLLKLDYYKEEDYTRKRFVDND